MRKILAVVWFQHNRFNFGIVITQNSIGEHKAWIGIAFGINEKIDMINIAENGAKFPLTAARMAINESGKDLHGSDVIEVP